MTENRKQKYIFGGMLVFAALVLVTGLRYGLPLWLVDDEPPFILAALKMIQLKTVLPIFHMEEFKPILYYPPYLAYLYLPIFAIIAGLKFLAFEGGAQQFAYYTAGDPSVFFVAARSVILAASLATIYLTYLVARRIFINPWASIASVFLMSTSVSYLALGMISRHWLPVTLIGVATLFLLTHPTWSFRKRYGWATFLLGAGFGVGVISAINIALLPLWYLFYEKRSFASAATDPFVYGLALAFAAMALIPGIIFPASFGFSGGIFEGVKTPWDFVASPLSFLRPLALAEPVLMMWAVIGIALALWRRERFAAPFTIFIILYSVIFYIFFYLTHRFTVPLIPFLALFAGYAVVAVLEMGGSRLFKVVALVTLAVPVAASAQLALLTFRNDSRVMAREWVENHIPADSKIMVLSPRLRLATRSGAIEEQRVIDPTSLRKVDEAEAALGGSKTFRTFYALNLYTVQNQNFFDNLADYAREHQYEYLIFTKSEYPRQAAQVSPLLENADELTVFGNERGIRAPGAEVFNSSLWDLFGIDEFGPITIVYKLKIWQ